MSLLKKKIKTNSRVINELLTNYKNTFSALCELLNNSLQAKAKNIDIFINYGDNTPTEPFIKEIQIIDNGTGVTKSDFENKILEIGTTAKTGGQGIGRFGALQIGGKIEIETVAFDKQIQKFTKIIFPLDGDLLQRNQLEEIEFEIDEIILEGSQYSSYYKVTIQNLYHGRNPNLSRRQKLTEDFKKENIKYSIFQQYPFEIFSEDVAFSVNGEKLRRQDFILGDPIISKEIYTNIKGKDEFINLYFYNVNVPLEKVKVFLCINNSGMNSVAFEYTYSSDWYTPDLGTWFIYVESSLFNYDLFRNIDLEELGNDELDGVKLFLKEHINEFFKKRNQKFEKFVADIDKDPANPLLRKGTSYTPSHEIVFKKVAYLIEDDYKLLRNDLKIREVVYPLINSALESGQIRTIFDKIVRLSPESVQKLHNLLDKTDLENVIHFSYQVAEKKEFLQFLHALIYGDLSKILKERSQLHKIIQRELWLFGESYSNTPTLWSDKQIGNIFNEIRKSFFEYQPSISDENEIDMEQIDGLNDITDLFFYNQKILDDDRKEFLIVELKSPKCAISAKELGQIDRYAFTIAQHNGLPKEKVKYKVILISSKITAFAKSKMDSAYEKYRIPFLFDKKQEKDIELYVVEWREIIESNKRKLNYLADSLAIKERSVREKFEAEYPNIITESVRSILRRNKESI